MPYQARGFWHCSFCERLFDDFHEAAYHESIGECHTRPLHQQQQHQHQQTLQQPLSPHHGSMAQGRPHPLRGPPMQGAAPSAGAVSVPPSAATAAGSAGATYHPGNPPIQHGSSPIPRRDMPPIGQPGPRTIFGGNDTSRLTEHDAVAVRNVEVFAVDHPEAMDTYGNRLAVGLVGIRCIHCIGSEAGPRSIIFPRSIQEVGDSIRELAEWHLGKCHRAPQAVHRVLEAALQKRHKAKNEGGDSWYQEEQDRAKLLEYCNSQCRDLRLVENYPPQTGVMFAYYGARSTHPGEPVHFEESKQEARSDLEGPFDPSDLSTFDDDLNPEPFMVPDQPQPAVLDPGFDNMPANFPFFREPTGDWICKFCQHIHPQYRDAQSRWAASHRSPPPAHFIDFHLNHCRMYQQSLLQDYRGPPNPVVLPNPIRPAEARPSMAGAAAATTKPSAVTAGPKPVPRSMQESSAGGPQTPYSSAIAYLEANDMSNVDEDGSVLPPEMNLVQDEDRLLLTDYFYYLFKQLRLCRFTETDRKTRGGKRQSIKIGYGGLQCVHCAGQQNPRKFFWANVDRIANSFAEMPNHILKCRHCPAQTREALLKLKETHAEQMTRLPRGSQKVFLRRMWRRLHANDPQDDATESPSRTGSESSGRRKAPPPPALQIAASAEETPPRPSKVARKQDGTTGSPGTSGSEGTIMVVERSTEEAAKALFYATMQAGPPSPSSRVLLATPEDKQWLSDHDCFVRKQIEVFCATREDVEQALADQKGSIQEGQVGLRCIHCALSKRGSFDGGGVYYPPSINAVYDAVREFQRLHMESCTNLPKDVRDRLAETKGAASLSSVLRNYFKMSAKSIGLVDTKDGIRATGKNVPLPSHEFTFQERKSPPREGKGRKPEKSEEV